jgi:hypothetical protein
MNLRELFSLYHNGFDNFPRWCDHHRAMHTKHPLGCEEFGAEWLRRWHLVGVLLNLAAATWHCPPHDNKWRRMPESGKITVAQAIEYFAEYDGNHVRSKVTLLNGIIIREWPAKDEYDDIF